MRIVQRRAWASNPTLRRGGEAEFFTYDQLKTRTVDSLNAYLRRRIGGYTVAIKEMPVTNRLYRGRICSEPPRTTGDISYPKPDQAKKFGRANRFGARE
jgi:hypothetical protein